MCSFSEAQYTSLNCLLYLLKLKALFRVPSPSDGSTFFEVSLRSHKRESQLKVYWVFECQRTSINALLCLIRVNT